MFDQDRWSTILWKTALKIDNEATVLTLMFDLMREFGVEVIVLAMKGQDIILVELPHIVRAQPIFEILEQQLQAILATVAIQTLRQPNHRRASLHQQTGTIIVDRQ